MFVISTSRFSICSAVTARARLNSIAGSFMECDGSDSMRFRSSDQIRTCAVSSRSCARSPTPKDHSAKDCFLLARFIVSLGKSGATIRSGQSLREV